MTEISSDLTVASGVSDALSRAASSLTAVQAPPSFADRTNVSANTNAKKSGADLVTAIHMISNSVVKDGNNIHSVASEFDSIDQKIKVMMNELSFTGGR